jgi:hypothetical protein
MICFAKPVLTEDLDVLQKEEFSMCECTLDERPSIFIRDKAIFSSEMMLYKDYDFKGSVEKKSLIMILRGLDPKTN